MITFFKNSGNYGLKWVILWHLLKLQQVFAVFSYELQVSSQWWNLYYLVIWCSASKWVDKSRTCWHSYTPAFQTAWESHLGLDLFLFIGSVYAYWLKLSKRPIFVWEPAVSRRGWRMVHTQRRDSGLAPFPKNTFNIYQNLPANWTDAR